MIDYTPVWEKFTCFSEFATLSISAMDVLMDRKNQNRVYHSCRRIEFALFETIYAEDEALTLQRMSELLRTVINLASLHGMKTPKQFTEKLHKHLEDFKSPILTAPETIFSPQNIHTQYTDLLHVHSHTIVGTSLAVLANIVYLKHYAAQNPITIAKSPQLQNSLSLLYTEQLFQTLLSLFAFIGFWGIGLGQYLQRTLLND